MKIKILSPDWGHTWLDILPQKFIDAGHTIDNKNPDVVLNMWADERAAKDYPEAKQIMWMRRYELFSNNWLAYDFSKVDCIIFVNPWIKNMAKHMMRWKDIESPRTELVYNAVDTSKWKYRKRSHGKKIGMACHIHPKKNLPLAIQILGMLPEDYELHIAGEIQDEFTYYYIDNLTKSMQRKVYMYGHVDRNQMDMWWEDKNYCLSTSISEGNPNNVLEAMAKGIKPIVHDWPGAAEQFEVFQIAEQAAMEIMAGGYNSEEYLDTVKRKYNVKNYDRIIEIAEEILCTKA